MSPTRPAKRKKTDGKDTSTRRVKRSKQTKRTVTPSPRVQHSRLAPKKMLLHRKYLDEKRLFDLGLCIMGCGRKRTYKGWCFWHRPCKQKGCEEFSLCFIGFCGNHKQCAFVGCTNDRYKASRFCASHGTCRVDCCLADSTCSRKYCDEHRDCAVDGCTNDRYEASSIAHLIVLAE